MRLVLDQGLPRSTADILRRAGFEVVHVGDIGMATADDTSILAWARTWNGVVVTFDADFHALLALSGASSPSVIRLRVEGLRAEAIAAVIHATITACAADLAAGAVVSADGHRARVRGLPLHR